MDSLSTIYFYHIVNTDTQQDFVADISIVEAILSRGKTELPQMRTAAFLCDIDACYQNRVFTVISPFVEKSRLRVHSVLHSEMQRGKGPADGNFPVVMSLITKFVN